MITYAFKSADTSDDSSRIIVKTVPVPATTQKVEFSLKQKEYELASAEAQLAEVQKRVDDIKAEILEVTTKLAISVTPVEVIK